MIILFKSLALFSRHLCHVALRWEEKCEPCWFEGALGKIANALPMLAPSHNEPPLFVFVIFVIVIVFVFVSIFVRSQIGSAPEQEQLALSHNEGALFDPNACSTYHPINPSGDQAGDKMDTGSIL